MSFFLLLSLFCCDWFIFDIRNTSIVLFLITCIWHFYITNKDVFTRSTTSNSLQVLHVQLCQMRMLPYKPAVKHLWLIHQVLEGHWIRSVFKLSNLCLKQMHRKIFRANSKETSVQWSFQLWYLLHCDFIHSNTHGVFTVSDTAGIFTWKS